MSKFSTASSHMVIRKKYGHDKGSWLLRTPFGLVTWAGLFLPERSSQSVELRERRGKARVLPFFSAGPPHFSSYWTRRRQDFCVTSYLIMHTLLG